MEKNRYSDVSEIEAHKTLRLTQFAYLGNRILGLPFWSLINLLAFILYKNLHISPLQITVIIALKPMSALFAPYWSQFVYQRPDRIIKHLMLANILRYIPFLFIPWLDSSWLIILAFGLNIMLYRASIPSWLEIIKCNLSKKVREQTLGYGCMIDYCGAALLTLLLGFMMDHYIHIWRWLFSATALLGLSSSWLLHYIPFVKGAEQHKISTTKPHFSLKNHVLKPWKQSWSLIRERADFRHYLTGFMIGGSGLMIMQPALPAFFVDTLKLSYTEMGMALAVCKGIGCGLTSQLWTRLFQRVNIYYFSGLAVLLAGLFPLLLLIAPADILLLYLAYVLYGIMQAGSEFSWHISGMVFSKDKDSSIFSSTNVLIVGLRGCIIPALGASLLPFIHSSGVMMLGGLLCFCAAGYLMHRSVKQLELV